jgi:hypothetical protein
MKITEIKEKLNQGITFPQSTTKSGSYQIFIEENDGKKKFWGFNSVEIVDAIKEFYHKKLTNDYIHWKGCALTLRDDFQQSEKLRTEVEKENCYLKKELDALSKLRTSLALINFEKQVSIDKLKKIKWPNYVLDKWVAGCRILFFNDDIYKLQKNEINNLIKEVLNNDKEIQITNIEVFDE